MSKTTKQMNKRIICIIVLICFFAQAAWAQTWTEVNTKEALNSAIANGAQRDPGLDATLK